MNKSTYVCRECGCPAEYHPEEQIWRHKDMPFIPSAFCNKYGNPIEVEEKKLS